MILLKQRPILKVSLEEMWFRYMECRSANRIEAKNQTAYFEKH